MTPSPQFPQLNWIGPAAAGHGSYTKRFFVWHCTAGNMDAAGEANFAKNRQDGIGTHFTADEDTLFHTLETWKAVGHVGSTVGNQRGIALEMCGQMSSPTSHYNAVTDRAMPGVVAACQASSIPARWLTSAQANDGSSKGWLTHDDCRRYFGGTTHTDPGPNFDRAYAIQSYSNFVNPPPPPIAKAPTLGERMSLVTCTTGSGAEKSINNLTVPANGRVVLTPQGPWAVPSAGNFEASYWTNTLWLTWAQCKELCTALNPTSTPTVDASAVAAAIVADPALGDLVEARAFAADQRAENE